MTMALLADPSAVAAVNRPLRLVVCLQLFYAPEPGQDVDALYPLCYTPTCRGHMPVSYVFRPLQTKKMSNSSGLLAACGGSGMVWVWVWVWVRAVPPQAAQPAPTPTPTPTPWRR